MEWYQIIEGRHTLWSGVSEPYKHMIRAFLVHFQLQILSQVTHDFNFMNGSIGGSRSRCEILSPVDMPGQVRSGVGSTVPLHGVVQYMYCQNHVLLLIINKVHLPKFVAGQKVSKVTSGGDDPAWGCLRPQRSAALLTVVPT
jgi:hypothetical protein